MNIALPYRHQRKPRRILGLDYGSPFMRGLVAAVPMTEAAGAPVEYVRQQVADLNAAWSNSLYGPSILTANGVGVGSLSFGDLTAYDTATDMTAVCLLNVLAWSTGTSGDFPWSKNAFQTRGWMLLNNGVFGDQVGFRQDRSGTSDYVTASRATVGTGFMLFVGRRTGLTIDFLTVKDGELTQHASSTNTLPPTPAGAELNISISDANGTVQVLSSWLWNYALPDAALRELYASPYQMFRTVQRTSFHVPAAPSTTIPRMMHHLRQQGIA